MLHEAEAPASADMPNRPPEEEELALPPDDPPDGAQRSADPNTASRVNSSSSSGGKVLGVYGSSISSSSSIISATGTSDRQCFHTSEYVISSKTCRRAWSVECALQGELMLAGWRPSQHNRGRERRARPEGHYALWMQTSAWRSRCCEAWRLLL